ncbi:MAG: type II toxin-antitoxin system HicA family toxin [Defluviitaleaceae bacterium]|nr:type II toxin-antitoxin system HicA family toxin [Defluviitaleaceae bacterium]
MKLLGRLLRRPKDFTFKELETLLVSLGFSVSNAGSTSGSSVKFINNENGHIIRLHKPHPNPELKTYLINYIISELKKGGYLNGK